jgi:hypothetical protein
VVWPNRVGVDLVKLREQPLLILLPDADPGVLHRKAKALLPLGFEHERDSPAGRSELDRVGEVVVEHLLELRLVGLDLSQACGDQAPELNPVVVGNHAHRARDLLHELV